MELVEDKHNSDFNIIKYSHGSITINEKTYCEPIIFSNSKISDFKISHPNLITYTNIEKYLDSVDLLLVGTGLETVILNEELIKIMFEKNKGLEFMNTQSACKTHNLLLSENRSFSSILYP
tara:strand:- start:1167 stop:1529 length:363 start_codon:yes stop_codon:yes gene_type:complete